jgi:hypothetical protein
MQNWVGSSRKWSQVKTCLVLSQDPESLNGEIPEYQVEEYTLHNGKSHPSPTQAMRLAIEFDGSVKDTTGLEGMLRCQGLCLLDDR